MHESAFGPGAALAADQKSCFGDLDAGTCVQGDLQFGPETTVTKWADAKMAPHKKPAELEHSRDNLYKADLADWG